MANNNEADYSLDFEVPSENDTSQLQSEILEDDIENSAADAQRLSAGDRDDSPPFSPDTPQQQQQQQYQQQHENRNHHEANQKLNDPRDVSIGDANDNEDDGTPKSKNQELDEIEDIIRKLEKLEKAQTILEDALHLSDAEADLPDISERSEKTEKSRGSASVSKSKSRSSYRSANSSQNNNGQKSSKSKSKNYSSSSEADNGDIDKEVDLRNDEELSAAINSGIESIRKLMEKDISPQEDITGAHPQPSSPKSPPSQSYSSSRATDKKSKSGSVSRSSHNFYNGRSKLKMPPKPVDGSGDSAEKTKSSVNNNINTTTDSPPDSVGNLKNEIVRQEALILAYQKENEKLYVQLKVAQEEIHVKEKSHEDELNDFKTQIATLKLSRLVPMPGVQGIGGSSSPRLGSAHKGELDRLNEELTVKSLMIVELRKEIALLKLEEQSRPSSAKVKQSKLAQQLSIDKEKEYQDNIRGLQKQVRTLQRILYNKDTAPSQTIPPSSATSMKGVTNPRNSLASRGRAMSLGKFEVGKRAVSAPNSDSEEIRKLEDKLRMERQNFQQQLSSKEVLLEENNLELNALRSELSKVKQAAAAAQFRREENRVDSDSENIIMEQLQSRLLNQSEIIQTLKEQLSALKNVEMERNALRREVANSESRIKELQRKLTRAETLAKPSFRQTSGANAKMDSRFTMNQEKEKEYQKQLQNLQKQVRTLQKILYNKDSTGSAPGTSTACRASGSASRDDLGLKPRPQTVGRTEILKRIEAPKPSYGTTQLLQSTLEHERQEFENLLSQKQRQVEDRERQIRELKAKLSATIEENAWITSESSVDKATYEEFRTKLLTQNKIIDSLKHRLASYGNTEAEKSMLRKEISHFEFRVQDLQRKLARAENLAKPENEVLTALSEKVEDLHTRYYYRERQLDALLDRLSLKTGQSSMGLSPRVYPTSGSYRSSCNFNGNSNSAHHTNHSDDYNSAMGRSPRNRSLDLGDLSPSTALNLIPHRDVPEI